MNSSSTVRDPVCHKTCLHSKRVACHPLVLAREFTDSVSRSYIDEIGKQTVDGWLYSITRRLLANN